MYEFHGGTDATVDIEPDLPLPSPQVRAPTFPSPPFPRSPTKPPNTLEPGHTFPNQEADSG